MSDQPPSPPPGWAPPQQPYPQQAYPQQQWPQQQWPQQQYPMPGPPPPRGFALPIDPGSGSVGLAVALGLVTAVIGGTAWCLVVAFTHFQSAYLALALGWFVAQGVLTGSMKHPRTALMVVAGSITAVACVVSEYYIVYARSDGLLPAIPSFSRFRFIVDAALRSDPLTALFWLAAIVASVVVTAQSDRTIVRRAR